MILSPLSSLLLAATLFAQAYNGTVSLNAGSAAQHITKYTYNSVSHVCGNVIDGKLDRLCPWQKSVAQAIKETGPRRGHKCSIVFLRVADAVHTFWMSDCDARRPADAAKMRMAIKSAGLSKMTSSKIEDVARAIDGALWHQIDTMEKYAVGGVETMSNQRSNSLRIARDVIKALREPTEAMEKSGRIHLKIEPGTAFVTVWASNKWNEMIEAILAEECP